MGRNGRCTATRGYVMMVRWTFRMALIGLSLMIPAVSKAEIPGGKIKIGILQDLPQPSADETGNGAIVAAQLAASDFEKEFLKGDAEILPGATDNSIEAVLGKVRDWLDKEHVAAILSSAGPLIDQQIARMVEQQHRTLLVASTESEVSGPLCSPNVIIWGTGPVVRAQALVQALLPSNGHRWLVLTDRSPAGIADQMALHHAVTAAGGQIVGPLDDVADGAAFGKAATKIAAADPQVVVLTQGDGDLIDVLRGARTASLPVDVTFAAPHALITDIDAAGPAVAEGLVVVAPFYWDANDTTRRFAQRWDERMLGRHITNNAAETYAATLSFLHAAKAVEDIDAAKVRAELGRTPIKGTLFGTVTIQPDGQVAHDLDVYRVKPGGQITRRWAYYDRLTTIPSASALPSGVCGKP